MKKSNKNEDLTESELAEMSQEETEQKYHSDGYDELYEEDVPKKRGSILVDLFNKVENFKLDIFKKNVKEKTDKRKDKKEKKKVLRDSKTTLTDIQQERRDVVKKRYFQQLMKN